MPKLWTDWKFVRVLVVETQARWKGSWIEEMQKLPNSFSAMQNWVRIRSRLGSLESLVTKAMMR